MKNLAAVMACVGTGVALLWRPGGSRPPNRESGLKLMLFTCWKSKRKGGSIPPLHTTSLQSAGSGAGRKPTANSKAIWRTIHTLER